MDLWYAASDVPPVRCVVRVIRDARVFTACLWTHPETRRLAWGLPVKPGTAIAGRIEFFPRQWLPDAWQPLDAAVWVWPGDAPAPLTTALDQMWSERASFAAVDAAESADLAREMERDRAGMGSRAADDDEVPEAAQAWRNVYTLKYEAVGSVSRGNLEARVCRALCYDRIIPGDLKKSRSNAAVLADLKRWFDDLHKDPTADYRPPFAPVVEDFRDYLDVMGWVRDAFADTAGGWAASREREIFAARIVDPPRTWDEIGRWYHLSRTAVKKRYDKALDRILAEANRLGPSQAQTQIESVRERNRAHKRRAVA